MNAPKSSPPALPDSLTTRVYKLESRLTNLQDRFTAAEQAKIPLDKQVFDDKLASLKNKLQVHITLIVYGVVLVVSQLSYWFR